MAVGFAKDSEFNKLLSGRSDIDLVWLLLEFAADAYSDVDWLSCLAEIDRLGGIARQRVAGHEASDLAGRMGEIGRLLHGEQRFRGNSRAYYDPRNSLLNEVLLRRRGIPISLAIVYIAVARRAGLEMHGFSTPGHFVIGCIEGNESLYLDPFHGGEVLTQAECRERIEAAIGRPGSLRDEDFAPATALEIAIRVLRNLKTAYAMANRWEAMLPVQQWLSLLMPQAPDERRDLGLIYLRIGKAPRAVQLLSQYAEACSREQALEVEPYLRSARRMTAELN